MEKLLSAVAIVLERARWIRMSLQWIYEDAFIAKDGPSLLRVQARWR